MSTRTTFGNLRNSANEVDLVDVGALIIGPIMASMLFGVFSLELGVLTERSLVDALWAVGGMEISIAFLLATFAGVWIIVTNLLNDQTQNEGYEVGMIAVAIMLPALMELVPAVESAIFWNDYMQILALIYVTGAYIWVSYTG